MNRAALVLVAVLAGVAASPVLADEYETPALSGCPLAGVLLGQVGNIRTNEIDKVEQANPGVPITTTPWSTTYSAPSSCTSEQYLAYAQRIVAVLQAGHVAAPTVQRVAFKVCGTWSQSAQNGGCSGAWQVFDEDATLPANAGLPTTITALKLIIAEYPCLTKADGFSLAGVVAQEWAGGPPTAWYPGRLDALSPGPIAPPFSARLPDGTFNAAGVAYSMLNYGMTTRETVAVIGGGHSFGGAAVTNSGWNGVFTQFGVAWPTPTNKYFQDLMNLKWEPTLVNITGRLQYVISPGQNVQYTGPTGKPVFRIPSDISLRESPTYAPWARAYAEDPALFVSDYSYSFQRLLQFGAGITWTPDTSFQWKGLQGNWEGFGPYMSPLSDSDGVPAIVQADFKKNTDFIREVRDSLVVNADPTPLLAGSTHV